MRLVELFTADDRYVATVEITPFPDKGMPRVLIWGVRTFVKRDVQPLPGKPDPWRYEECFAFTSLTASPGVERWKPPELAPPPPVDWDARGVAGRSHERGEADTTIKPNGQQKEYVVLTDDERAKGFQRPVRLSYKHVGRAAPRFPLRDLTAEEQARYNNPESAGGDCKYAKFEQYPESESPHVGRYWTQADLDRVGKGCGTVTSMSRDIAETYAREPRFYGKTFCPNCRTHIEVGEAGEFVWLDDGSRVGT